MDNREKEKVGVDIFDIYIDWRNLKLQSNSLFFLSS